MNATDLTNLACASFLLKSDTRNVDDDLNNICLGMNFVNLSDMLKLVRKDGSVTIMANRDSDFVELFLERFDKLNCTDCKMRLMDIDCENFGIKPDSDYDGVVTMPSSAFLDTCRLFSNLGETIVEISVTDEGLRVSANYTDQNAEVFHTHNAKKGDEATIIELKKTVSLTFGLRYLVFFTKATSLSNTMSISMSSNMPLMVEYKIEDIGFIRFYLALKME